MCDTGACGCNGQWLGYWPYDRAPWEDAGPLAVQVRILSPGVMAGSLAGAWMRTKENQIEGEEYNQSDLGLAAAAAITRPWLAGLNVDTGFVPGQRGTLAEAQWTAQIRAVQQSNVLGRP